MSRSRLTPEQRREHLMDVGVRLFTDLPSDEVTMEQIGREAGVSRALVYHYFPGKRELFGAIWKRAHDGLLASVELDGDEPLVVQVRRGLSAHCAFYEANSRLVFLANRSEMSTDRVVRDPVDEDLDTIRGRILAATGAVGHQRSIAAAGLAGWIAFVREASLEWLQRGEVGRDELVELCMDALIGAIGGVVDLDRPPQRPDQA